MALTNGWGKRIFWMTAIIALISGASAALNYGVRVKLDERDAIWKKRLDALESDVELLKRAKLGQDDFNAQVIRMLEKTEKQDRREKSKKHELSHK